MGRTAVTGSVAFDTIMVFNGRFGEHILPDKAHVLNVAFLVGQLERRRGGTASNIAYSMAMLGEHPLLCAAVGAGDFVAFGAALEAKGVDTSSVLRCDDIDTATAFITTDLDGNQITAFHPGAMTRAAGVDLSALTDVSEVIVGADDAAAMGLHIEQARTLGARLIFVPAQQIPAMPDEVLRAGLDQAWLVAGNDYELEMIRERTGRTIADLSGGRMVAVTKGGAGSEIHTPDGVSLIPPAVVEVAVDPTGAGDAYIAGLVTGFRAGATPDVAGRMGSVAAAYVVGERGPQTHHFTPATYSARYAATFGSEPPLPSLPQA
ncbi:MAG: PfkB family carbohydrate kinase [Candidatus Dormiibacterota bacterium]